MTPPISGALVSKIKEEAGAFFHSARGSHDWGHTERVHRLCLRIGRREKADLGVLELAALLHDIGREEEDRSSGKVCHGRSGAALAKGILERHGLDRASVGAVVHCIRTHRFRKRAVPRTLEARILFDADKLDSIGAVGVGRAFLFAGEVGARLHDKAIDVRKTKPYTREDTAYREYLVKLGRVKDRMTTREGKRIAVERHRFMAAFFDRLNKETDGVL
ncbi:MAG TPA: HD domain-containing protein [Candidatus Latescibacteria bacterium]|nr:HD domain-containing protein [Candidatus Latescibacterota bacterium]